jgi:hypothetical protein
MKNEDKMSWSGYAVIAIVVLILFLPLVYYSGQSKTVSGTVTLFYNVQLEDQPVYLVVVLDDGSTVQASATDNVEFKKGHKVLLNERTTVFGGKNYKLLKYLN